MNNLTQYLSSYDRFIKMIKTPILVALNTSPGMEDSARVVLERTISDPIVLKNLNLLKEHDEYTYNHSINVAVLSFFLGYRRGYDIDMLTILTKGAALHDIGKTGVPLSILNKPGRLTSEEFSVITTHSEHGYNLVKNTKLEKEVKEIILYHHIRLDGSGYPDSSDEISNNELIQIVSLCDVFDALTGDRVYKPGMSKVSAYRIICAEMENKLNTGLLDLLLENFSMFDVGDMTFTTDKEKCIIVALNTDNLNRPIIEILEGKNKGKVIDLSVDNTINLSYT